MDFSSADRYPSVGGEFEKKVIPGRTMKRTTASRNSTANAKEDILSRSRFYRTIPIPGIVVLSLIFLLPLTFTLSRGFIDDQGKFSVAAIVSDFTSPYTLRIMAFTLVQAFVSTFVSLLIGLPGAYLMATYRFPGKKIIRAICTIPFVLPTILVVLGFVIFYGNNGLLNRALMRLFSLKEPPIKLLYSFTAVILAHAFYNFPIALNLVSSFWEHMDVRCEQAAATMGAKRGRIFRTITLPRLMPAIISAASLIFLFCFTSFAIILVLGGGPQFTTIEVEIYRRARMSMDVGGAASLSLFSILITCLLLLWYSATQRALARQESFSTMAPALEKKPATRLGRFLAILYSVLAAAFVLAPLVSVVIRSFMAPVSRAGGESFSLKWYRQLFGFSAATGHMGTAADAIVHSLSIAAVVALVTIPIALTVAASVRRSRTVSSTLLELLVMLPMAVSSVIIGLGYYLIASRLGGRDIGFLLVVLAHMVIATPFVLRTVLPEYRKIPATYSQAAMTLGATPARTFWSIEVPLLRTSLVTGAMFAFAISMGEINATLTLADSKLTTLPLVMYRLINAYNYQGACALGTILILVCAIVFIGGELLKRNRHGR